MSATTQTRLEIAYEQIAKLEAEKTVLLESQATLATRVQRLEGYSEMLERRILEAKIALGVRPE